MKKIITTIFLLLITIMCYSQPERVDHIFVYQTFEADILNYIPFQRDGVTDKKFNYALHILADTKAIVKDNPQNLNSTDFWNITTAFVILKEPKANVEISFKKAIAKDANDICSIIKISGASSLEKIIPETFLPFYTSCLQNTSGKEAAFDIKKYTIDNKLNFDLVSLMNDIQSDDQKFRTVKPFNYIKQKAFDLKNLQLIDSLYKVYKTYIGKSLVGKQFEGTMWLVVQHSNIRAMERYLPDVQKAVQEKELDVVPLKMLIDRIYYIKYGYQIFGSQAGVTLSDEKIKAEIIKKYNLQ